MSRVKKILIWSVAVVVIVWSMVRFDTFYYGHSVKEIMAGYLGEVHMYCILISSLIVPYMIILHVPYKEAMIRIRLKGKAVRYVIGYNVAAGVGVSIYIFASFLVSSFLMQKCVCFEAEWGLMMLGLTLFVIACFMLRELVYIVSKRAVFGALLVLVMNYVAAVVMNVMAGYM